MEHRKAAVGADLVEHPEAAGASNQKRKRVIEVGSASPRREGFSRSAPCGACKFLKRKCRSGCVFAPHFSADHSGATLFETVHEVFGAANVSNLLLNIPQERREEAMVSVLFEAEARMLDPTNGCMLKVAAMERQLQQEVDELRAKILLMRGLLSSAGGYPPQQMQMFQHAGVSSGSDIFQHAGLSSGLVGSSSMNNNLLDNLFGDAGGVTNEMPFHSLPQAVSAVPYPFELQKQSIYDMVPSNRSHLPQAGLSSGLVGSSSMNNNLLDNLFGDAGGVTNEMPFHSLPQAVSAVPYPFELQHQSIYDMVPSNHSHFPQAGLSSGLVGSSSMNNNLLDNLFVDAGGVTNELPFHSLPQAVSAVPYPFELQRQSIYDMVPSNHSHFPHAG